MSPQTFVVTTQLGIDLFDDRRVGRGRVKGVMAEVRRIKRADRRIREAKLQHRRGCSDGYELHLRIAAPTGWDAFEIGSSVVRAAIHAVGGSTAGWEQIRPKLDVPAYGREKWARPPSVPSWADATGMAMQRVAAMPWMPPMYAPVPVGVGVIDLR